MQSAPAGSFDDLVAAESFHSLRLLTMNVGFEAEGRSALNICSRLNPAAAAGR
jgi:hypothetical protein